MMNSALPLHQLPAPESIQVTDPTSAREAIGKCYAPLVLRGFASEWQIVKAGETSAEATAAYLAGHAESHPQSLVSLAREYRGKLFYNADFTGMNFERGQSGIADGIGKMLAGPRRERDYCFQCVPVKAAFPDLYSALPNPLLPVDTARFAWIGNQITVPPHFDEAENIAVVAVGRRRFTFFPPQQVANLYVGPLDFTPAGQPISMVDIEQPDLSQHPKYEQAYAEALSVELAPGDAVYIPSPWWHSVRSLDDFNVLVNYWWSSARVSSALPLPALGHAIQAFAGLPAAQRHAWLAMMQHFVFADREQAAEHIPAHGRGVAGPLTPQVQVQLHQWIKQNLG